MRRERQSLNAAVREYLSQSGYKLTAITFVEEAGDPGQGARPCPLPDMLRAHSVLGPTLEAHRVRASSHSPLWRLSRHRVGRKERGAVSSERRKGGTILP